MRSSNEKRASAVSAPAKLTGFSFGCVQSAARRCLSDSIQRLLHEARGEKTYRVEAVCVPKPSACACFCLIVFHASPPRSVNVRSCCSPRRHVRAFWAERWTVSEVRRPLCATSARWECFHVAAALAQEGRQDNSFALAAP